MILPMPETERPLYFYNWDARAEQFTRSLTKEGNWWLKYHNRLSADEAWKQYIDNGDVSHENTKTQTWRVTQDNL